MNAPGRFVRSNFVLFSKSGYGIAAGRDGVQYCGSCGALVVQTPKKRHKRFCSDRCRYRWWNRSRGAQAGKGAAHTCACCGAHYFSYHGSSKYCGHPCYIAQRFVKGASPHGAGAGSRTGHAG